jgi:hypothetical protein
VNNGVVFDVYTNSPNWQFSTGAKVGMTPAELKNKLIYVIPCAPTTNPTNEGYVLNGALKGELLVTAYYDAANNYCVDGFMIYGGDNTPTKYDLHGYQGPQKGALLATFEYQLWDLANTVRVKAGKEPFILSEEASQVARKYSENEFTKGFIDLSEMKVTSPETLLIEAGIGCTGVVGFIGSDDFMYNPVSVHYGMMKKDPGYRAGILSNARIAGFGSALNPKTYGWESSIHTAIFYTPQELKTEKPKPEQEKGKEPTQQKEPPVPQQKEPSGYLTDPSEISVYVNGQRLNFDVPPCIINGRTMVPMRAIFEALGATVEWDGAEQKITARGTDEFGLDVTLELWVNKYEGMLYGYRGVGGPIELDVPPTIFTGRTMVPTRVIAESLGASVTWNGELRRVEITKDVPSGDDLPGKEAPAEKEEVIVETEDSPSEAVVSFLESVKRFELQKASTFFGEDGYDWGIGAEDEALFRAIFGHLTYDTPQMESGGQTEAVVMVNITSPDLETVFLGVLDEIIADESMYVDLTDEELDQLVVQLVIKAVNSPNCPRITIETRLELMKLEGGWIIVGEENLAAALSGNLTESFAE